MLYKKYIRYKFNNPLESKKLFFCIKILKHESCYQNPILGIHVKLDNFD